MHCSNDDERKGKEGGGSVVHADDVITHREVIEIMQCGEIMTSVFV